MKTHILFGFLVVSAFITSCDKDDNEENKNVNLTQGLLAYYPFSGNVNDESGNGNHGTIVNGATIVADMKGNPSAALSVNGTNGVMVTNGPKLTPQDEMTISFDVMARQTGRQVYISSVNYNTGHGFNYMVSSSIPGETRTTFVTARNGAVCDNFAENTTGILGATFEKESWYTVVATFKSGALKMYVNNKLVAEGPAPSSKINLCANANFLIGTWWKNDPAGLNGKIDNVRVYNRVLNADEIEELNNCD